MKNRTTRFLVVSLAAVALLCVAVFSFLAVYMNKRSAETITEVGAIYMTGMSEQISLHFETNIGLRLEQADALVKTVPPDDSIHTDETLRDNFCTSAQALKFDYLGFYTVDGGFDMLYGAPLQVVDPGPFMQSLLNHENKVAIGTDADGNSVILLGVPALHAPTEEHPCVALVAAIPASYIGETLSLDTNSEHVYSFIIREDGSFVVRTGDVSHDNYFDRVRALYEDVNGMTPEEYLTELCAAMERGEEYSNEFTIYGEQRHLYCTRLAYSEWYLLTFMPYGSMDDEVGGLSAQWMYLALAGCGVILAALLLVFYKYFGLTHRQLRAVEEARREAENARQAAERASKAKSEFLSNMSHDIRTPMNAIVGMTAIATANIDDKRQVQNCLKKITRSSKHLLGLINDVLDMSKIESGKLTLNMDLVSLREVMESMVNIVQPQVKAKNQRFDVFIHDISAEDVLCDGVRLNQVLLNFLSNAVKFTPEGGEIQVSMFEEESPKGDDYVRVHFHVKDNGIGMAPEFKEKIFESFTREDNARVHKTEGTGLGMAITKYIVDTMGGTIEVDSEPGQGSEFRVTLDLEKATVPETEMILPEWNMLVVDDDQQLCESTVDALKAIGIRADWTLDGESAVEMVTRCHHRENAYQIILLDWKLPGMDGVETAKRLREKLGDDVPILLISAYDWGEIEPLAREAGITGFISKPLFKSTLFYGLRQFAGQDAGAVESRQEEEPGVEGLHILLAEDNDLNWEIAEELFSEVGLELERAENGQVCVDMFRNSPVGAYDAVLMDIRMPVMGGHEAARAIRAMDRPDADIPIIAMTADAFAEDVQKALDCGMNAHVAKPIDVREVVRLLKKYIQ